MEKLVKESGYFVAWLVFWLCATAAAFIVLAFLGPIIDFLLGATGFDPRSTQSMCVMVAAIIGIPLSYGLFRLFVGVMIVKKIQRRLASTTVPPPFESPLPYEAPQ